MRDHEACISPPPSNSHVFNLESCYSVTPTPRSTMHQNKCGGLVLTGNFGSSVSHDHKKNSVAHHTKVQSGYEWALQLGLVIECDTVCVCRACRTERLCNRTGVVHFVILHAWLPSLIRISVTTQSLTWDAITLQFIAHLYVK
jgi:hypothetical protein